MIVYEVAKPIDISYRSKSETINGYTKLKELGI